MAKETETKLETAIETKLVKSVEKNVIGKVDSQIRNMKENVSKALEIEKRKNNLIVHGLKDWKEIEGEDRALIEDMLSTGLNIDAVRHIEKVTRLGQFVENKIRPITN